VIDEIKKTKPNQILIPVALNWSISKKKTLIRRPYERIGEIKPCMALFSLRAANCFKVF
jgi:hypothetical protein